MERPGSGHIGLTVDDVDAMHRSLLDAGGTVKSAPVELTEPGDWFGVRCMTVLDPDGVAVELVERPRLPRSSSLRSSSTRSTSVRSPAPFVLAPPCQSLPLRSWRPPSNGRTPHGPSSGSRSSLWRSAWPRRASWRPSASKLGRRDRPPTRRSRSSRPAWRRSRPSCDGSPTQRSTATWRRTAPRRARRRSPGARGAEPARAGAAPGRRRGTRGRASAIHRARRRSLERPRRRERPARAPGAASAGHARHGPPRRRQGGGVRAAARRRSSSADRLEVDGARRARGVGGRRRPDRRATHVHATSSVRSPRGPRRSRSTSIRP